MKKIEPYPNKNEAIRSLDNGGRFYNLKAKAKDGLISKSELGKVGGFFNDKQQMILFLEMAILRLNQSDKEEIISSLDDDLKEIYQKYKSQELLPSEANAYGEISSNAIITGIPKLIDSESNFKGFVLFPIIAGNVTSIILMPLIDRYDVYELKDEASSKTFLIAHSKESNKLPNRKIIIGGVLKELSPDENGIENKGKFLEATYHIDININASA